MDIKTMIIEETLKDFNALNQRIPVDVQHIIDALEDDMAYTQLTIFLHGQRVKCHELTNAFVFAIANIIRDWDDISIYRHLYTNFVKKFIRTINDIDMPENWQLQE